MPFRRSVLNNNVIRASSINNVKLVHGPQRDVSSTDNVEGMRCRLVIMRVNVWCDETNRKAMAPYGRILEIQYCNSKRLKTSAFGRFV